MKLTKAQLKHVIREELETISLAEGGLGDAWRRASSWPRRRDFGGGSPPPHRIVQIDDPRAADVAVGARTGATVSVPSQQDVRTHTPFTDPVGLRFGETMYTGDPEEVANVAREEVEPWWQFWEGKDRSNLEQIIREELETILKKSNRS